MPVGIQPLVIESNMPSLLSELLADQDQEMAVPVARLLASAALLLIVGTLYAARRRKKLRLAGPALRFLSLGLLGSVWLGGACAILDFFLSVASWGEIPIGILTLCGLFVGFVFGSV